LKRGYLARDVQALQDIEKVFGPEQSRLLMVLGNADLFDIERLSKRYETEDKNLSRLRVTIEICSCFMKVMSDDEKLPKIKDLLRVLA
jgi:hypothetical protein